MGTYINVVAKPGCENQINAAWAVLQGNPKAHLVYSEAVIAAEIAYIQSPAGGELAHLRPHLKTVEDWEEIYPALKRGTGSFKISGVEDSNEEEWGKLKQQVAFILDNRLLFNTITGLDDARESGLTNFHGDAIEQNQVVMRTVERLSFNDLPKGNSALYRNCLKYDRPDIWKSYLDYAETQNETNWINLRQKLVPWSTHVFGGVWGLVEQIATEMDGKSFGLIGRYRDGNIPSLFLVRQALEGHDSSDNAQDTEELSCM